MAASQNLLTQAEEICGEIIPSEGEGDSLACKSFEEALFGWARVLKDSDEFLPLTE